MKDLILIALESEAPTMAKWDNVFFTGVGKINAALTAARLIEKVSEKSPYALGTKNVITKTLPATALPSSQRKDK